MRLLPLFDRKRQRHLLSNAITMNQGEGKNYFLHKEVESLVIERLSFVKSHFERVLLTSITSCEFKNILWAKNHGLTATLELHTILETIQAQDLKKPYFLTCLGDEEYFSFKDKSFNFVLSFLTLSHLNDIQPFLSYCKNSLRDQGLFMAVFLGGESFIELRACLMQAELDIKGGAAARVHPMISLQDSLHLFIPHSFKLPVVDCHKIIILYPSLKKILYDIKAVGHSNSLIERSPEPLTRAILHRAEDLYIELYATPEKQLKVSIEIIFMTGWT